MYKITLGWMYYRDKPSSGSSRSCSRVVLLSPGHVASICALMALHLASTQELSPGPEIAWVFITSLVWVCGVFLVCFFFLCLEFYGSQGFRVIVLQLE